MLFNPSNFLLGFYWVPVFHFDTGTPDHHWMNKLFLLGCLLLLNRRQDCHLRIINVCQTTKWFYKYDQSQHHHVSSFELICLKRWAEKYPRNPYIFLGTSSADTLMSWSLRAATIRLMALFRLSLSMYFECFTLKRSSSWLPKFIKTRVPSFPHYFAFHRFLLLFWFKSFFMGTSCDNTSVVSRETAPDVPCETIPGEYCSSNSSLRISSFATSLLHVCSSSCVVLKVQSCKLYNSKYMIASTQITNTEIFALISVLVFKLLSRKAFFINLKDNRNRSKVGCFLRK